MKVEIEVRVELSTRRKEIAENAANYISRGGGLQQFGVKRIQRNAEYVWRVVMQVSISSRQSVLRVVVDVGLEDKVQ